MSAETPMGIEIPASSINSSTLADILSLISFDERVDVRRWSH